MTELRLKAQEAVRQLVYAFIKFPKLLVAVVNGPSIGIAATTAALCDVIYATENVSATEAQQNKLVDSISING